MRVFIGYAKQIASSFERQLRVAGQWDCHRLLGQELSADAGLLLLR
jgi:hypothetical protein